LFSCQVAWSFAPTSLSRSTFLNFVSYARGRTTQILLSRSGPPLRLLLIIAKGHIQSWRESFAGIVPQAYLDKMSLENRAKAFEKGFGQDFTNVCSGNASERVGFAIFWQGA
jgi:hypothetical protein